MNNKKVTIASFRVSAKDEIGFYKDKSKKIPYIDVFRTQNEVILPEWLEQKKDSGTMVGKPDSSLIDKQVNLRLVVEFYSR